MTIELEVEINRIAIIMLLAHGFLQKGDRTFLHSDGRTIHLPDQALPNSFMAHISREIRKLVAFVTTPADVTRGPERTYKLIMQRPDGIWDEIHRTSAETPWAAVSKMMPEREMVKP